MGERLTVQIDYCPQCRGVWLGNGKLDKIIEQSAPVLNKRNRDDDEDSDEHGRRRRKSFWDIFD